MSLPHRSIDSRFVLNLFFTHKLGPNGGAEDGAQKRLQLLVKIQFTTSEREFEMPGLLLADNTEARSNLISSFSTKKKRDNNSCTDDIYFWKSTSVTCQAAEVDDLVDVSTVEKSLLTTFIF